MATWRNPEERDNRVTEAMMNAKIRASATQSAQTDMSCIPANVPLRPPSGDGKRRRSDVSAEIYNVRNIETKYHCKLGAAEATREGAGRRAL